MKRFLLSAALAWMLVVSGTTTTSFGQGPQSKPQTAKFRVVENASPALVQWVYKTARPMARERLPADIRPYLQNPPSLQTANHCVTHEIWQGLGYEPMSGRCAVVVVTETVCLDGTRFQNVIFELVYDESCGPIT